MCMIEYMWENVRTEASLESQSPTFLLHLLMDMLREKEKEKERE